MPRVSQEKQILQAALTCFAELGYEGTRVKHIADKAGVVESALYRHYKSKEEIAQTLFSQSFADFTAKLQQVATETAEKGVEATLRAFAHLGVEDFKANQAALSFILLQRPNFVPVIAADTVSPLDVIASVIASGQKQGLIRSGEPGLLAAAFVGCFLQPIAFARAPLFHSTDIETVFATVDTLADLAWAALANPTKQL